MALIRWQNLLFALLPAIDALQLLWRSRASGDTRAFREVAGRRRRVCRVRDRGVPAADAGVAGHLRRAARALARSGRRFAGRIRTWSTSSGRRATVCSAPRPILYLGAIGLIVFAFVRPAAGVPMVAAVGRDDLFQRLHPGLVGQRRLRRAAVRRRDPDLLRRARRVRRRHGGLVAASRDGGRDGAARRGGDLERAR